MEEVDVPSVREVAVVPITGRVAVGENPGTRAPIIELVDGDEHLVKEGHEVDGVAVGAITVVEVLDGVRHVRLVIGGVQVHAVPAGREEDLSAHAIRTVVVEEVGAFCPVRVVVMSAAKVYRAGSAKGQPEWHASIP